MYPFVALNRKTLDDIIGIMRGKQINRLFFVLNIILIVVLSIFTIAYMGVDSFHHDELYSIAFFSKTNSLKDMLWIFLTDEVTNPPLYYIFMYFWYRLVPSTEIWLLIPNYFFFITGLFSLSFLVYRYTQKMACVFFLTIITWINAYTFGFMLYNLRAYCLLFMLSSLIVYVYDLVIRKSCFRYRILLGFLFFTMCFTHYYGIIVAAGYAVFDLFLVIKKKQSLLNTLISYIVLSVLLCPYLAIAFTHRKKNLSEFWGMLPSPLRVIKTIAQFFGNEYLFIIFSMVIVLWLFYNYGTLRSFTLNSENLIYLTCLFVGFFTFTVSYVYSFFINPHGGIYVEQYFISVKPLFLLLFSFLWNFCINKFLNRTNKNTEIYIYIISSLIILLIAVYGGKKWFNRHLFKTPTTRNMAEYIKKDIESHPDNTAAVYVYQTTKSQWHDSKYPIQGYREFYLQSDTPPYFRL